MSEGRKLYEVGELELASPLAVFVDVKSANSFLAIKPTQALADELGLHVDWRPYVMKDSAYAVYTEQPRDEPLPEDVAKRHAMVRARYIIADQDRYAKQQGLTLIRPTRTVDSDLFAMGLLWARKQPPPFADRYVSASFERFWRQELDIESIDDMASLIQELNEDAEGFTLYVLNAGPGDLETNQKALDDINVIDTPTYLVADDIFIGRQHLPLIKWHLTRGSVESKHNHH